MEPRMIKAPAALDAISFLKECDVYVTEPREKCCPFH